MIPENDPSWPMCQAHDVAQGPDPVQHWCEWTRQFFFEGRDAGDITWGLRYCIPVVPTHSWWAEVSIATEKLAGSSGMLYLIKEKDAFTTEEEEISLGLWTKGEGRMSIASSLRSWINAQDTEKCEWSGHSFEQEIKCQTLEKLIGETAELQKKSNRWCLAYYGCCIYCWAGRSTAQQGAQTFNAANFGISPNTVGTGNTGTARSQSIAIQLNQKYGQRTAVDLPDENWHTHAALSPRERALYSHRHDG